MTSAEPARESSGTTSSSSPASIWLRTVTLIALIFTFGNALWAAWDQDTTTDEFYHLEWPRRLLHDRVDERESAFRFDSKTPVLLPAVVLVDVFEAMGAEAERTLRFASRLVPVAFLAACLGLSWILAGRFGREASWLALLLGALEPNLAANASIATSDLAYAVAGLLFVAAVSRSERSWTGAAVTGIAVGIAFSVKYTAVLLTPLAAVYVMSGQRHRPLAALGRLCVTGLVACLSVSACYLMVGVGRTLGSLSFHTQEMVALSRLLPDLPLPFPAAILTGIDLSRLHDTQTSWSCYLLGETHPGGVWYYFVAHWVLKTPVALMALLITGLWSVRDLWRDRLVGTLAVVFGVHLAYFSFLFSTQIGYRFVLVCVPLAGTAAAIGLSRISEAKKRLIPILGLLVLVERAPYWSDPIAFTSLAVWPKSRAYWYTADSNLDYGQNRDRVERYVRESGLSAVVDQTTVTPGLYVITANNLTSSGNFRANRWLIDNDVPAVSFGFTAFGFSITDERFEAYMNEARIAPTLATYDELCSGDLTHYAPGSQIPFSQTEGPREDRLWVICAYSKKGVDLGFRVDQGRLFFGRVTSDRTCSTELLQAGQQSWARIRAGSHAQLCLREVPYRRSHLTYTMEGTLRVRGQGADIDIRLVPKGGLSAPYSQDALR